MPDLEVRALILVLAILLDWLMGDPKRLYQHIFHPVQFMGEFLSWMESGLNKPHVSFFKQKLRGAFALFFYLLVWVLVGVAITIMCDVAGIWGWGIEVLVVAVLLSGRSLYDHVKKVCEALKFKTVEEARVAIAHIVGRDPAALDDRGVARAAIESGAENLSDGFIGPILFYLVGGLPGLFLYKATNTADSMIGHKTQRFLGFGWAAAKLDDVFNWLPARLTGFIIVILAHLLCGRGSESWRVMMKDAHKHSSPNAGWPESAMAGALGIAVAGPRVYREMMKQDPWINARGRLDASAEDIWNALRLMKAGVYFPLPFIAALGLMVFL